MFSLLVRLITELTFALAEVCIVHCVSLYCVAVATILVNFVAQLGYVQITIATKLPLTQTFYVHIVGMPVIFSGCVECLNAKFTLKTGVLPLFRLVA